MEKRDEGNNQYDTRLMVQPGDVKMSLEGLTPGGNQDLTCDLDWRKVATNAIL